MQDNELFQKWPELKAKLLETYPDLCEEDLVLEIGKEAELQERIQKKLGKNWNDMRNLLSLMG